MKPSIVHIEEMKCYMKILKVERLLAWEPKVGLKEGLRKGYLE